MADIDQMLANAQADSWSDLEDDGGYVFDDERASKLERLTSYVDYCFETYPVVSNNLDRDQIQTCVADWDKRRGLCKYDAKMHKREFGKQVRDTHRKKVRGNYAIFLATPLVGVKPENDRDVGWKACVRHELGHAIDHYDRGESDHSKQFKAVMRQFCEDVNDGQHAHGWAPKLHR